MESTTTQHMTVIGLAKEIGPVLERENEPWYESPHITTKQDTQSIIQPSYVRCQQHVNNEIPTAAQWWRDASIINASPHVENQDESLASDYRLLDHPIEQQATEESPLTELIIKNSVKFKEPKRCSNTKGIDDNVKRTKHPEKWKVNIKKNARLRGEEYVGVGGKIVQAKVMGPPCNCRMRCSVKIDENARKELHHVFWKTCNWEQRKQYIALSVKESPKQRTRCRGDTKSDRRQVTFTYSLLMNGDFVTVCKCMFLSTFSVSEKFVRHAMDKKRSAPGGIIGPDQRGRHTPKTKKTEAVKERVREHIKSFPTEKSLNPKDRTGKRYLDSRLSIAAMHKLYVLKCNEDGIPESDIVKESYYREMFKTEFNLGFKQSKNKNKRTMRPSNLNEKKTQSDN